MLTAWAGRLLLASKAQPSAHVQSPLEHIHTTTTTAISLMGMFPVLFSSRKIGGSDTCMAAAVCARARPCAPPCCIRRIKPLHQAAAPDEPSPDGPLHAAAMLTDAPAERV